jgi:hypothetical protein
MMMINLKVEALAREFYYNGIRIPDRQNRSAIWCER